MNLIEKLKSRVIAGEKLTKSELLQLAGLADKEALYLAANEIRSIKMGEEFDTCSIINARSGICPEDCKWCSQSLRNQAEVEQYDIIDRNEALAQAKSNEEYGVNRFSLVTSSKALSKSKVKQMSQIYKDIRSSGSKKIGLCASMGLLDRERLAILKEAGIGHYHMNLETSRNHFPKVCTTHSYDDKIETIKAALELGIDVCSGGIIGMGERMEDRIDMAMELRELGVKSIPINLLNPIEGTPLEGQEALSDDEILTTMALFRFINPEAKLRFAGGRLQMKHIEEKALKSGMNAALVGDLLTTIGSKVEEDMKNFEEAGFKMAPQEDVKDCGDDCSCS